MQDKNLLSEEKSVSDRLKEALLAKGYRKNIDFLRDSGLKRPTFYAILKENRLPRTSTREALIRVGINPDYVAFGGGSILLDERTEPTSNHDVEYTGAEPEQERSTQQGRTSGDSIGRNERGSLTMEHLRRLYDAGGTISHVSRKDLLFLLLRVIDDLERDEAEAFLKMAQVIVKEKPDAARPPKK